MQFARFLKVTVLAVAAMVVAAPAHAQTNKPIRSGTWYEDRATNSSNNGQVFLTFAQAPTDKFLNITHVACNAVVSLGLVLNQAYVGGSTNGNPFGPGDLGRTQNIRGASIGENTTTNRFYLIVTETFLKLGPGRFPYIEFAGAFSSAGQTGLFVGADCVIVGNLSDD